MRPPDVEVCVAPGFPVALPRGTACELLICPHLLSVPASCLCGAIARRDRRGRGTAGRPCGACRVWTGRHVSDPGGPAGVPRADVSRAWSKATGGGRRWRLTLRPDAWSPQRREVRSQGGVGRPWENVRNMSEYSPVDTCAVGQVFTTSSSLRSRWHTLTSSDAAASRGEC